MSDLTHVKGLDALQKFLDTLPAKMERNVMRGALRAGMKLVQEEAKANVGVISGELRDGLKVSTSAKGGVVMSRLRATGKHGFVARWVEFGTVAHTIKANALAFRGRFAKSVEHPGAKQKPFMRPALDNKAQEAVIAAGNYIKNRLATKQGLDTADIEIGGEE